jgi:hypothetical protein
MPYARRARVQDELVKVVVVLERNLEDLSVFLRRSANGKTAAVRQWLLAKVDAHYLAEQRMVFGVVSEAGI